MFGMIEIENKDIFVKTDENVFINPKFITWMKKMEECLHICTKSNGCGIDDTHKICKENNIRSYDFFIRKTTNK